MDKEKELKFTFSQSEAQLILNALLVQPYGEVAEVVGKLQSQAAEQMGKDGNK
jgi:hypothetical protein